MNLLKAKKWKYYSVIWSRFDGRWKWEGQPHQQYTQVELLSQLGQMGWELAAIAPYSDDGNVMAHEYIFKKKT